MRTHRYAAGQHVSYAEDASPAGVWRGGYEIVALLPAGSREPQYQIRSDDQAYDQVVWEFQLREDFGRRTMRLSELAMQATTMLASPPWRARHPKRPSRHEDLTRWDDEGGAPRSGHRFSEHPPLPSRAETALYYFNVRTESNLMEDPEGNRYPDLQAARDVAVALAHTMIAEGHQKGEDRRRWHVEVTNRANQPVLTVAFADVLGPTAVG
ncbi:hypothetical protein HPT29_024750 (plasmid) [Microvirga terrae]|uniref:DUF6894 domain-containing protein n=1 Tax=Microvirga terrae TaxID=2740529 RepID=A0ABY5S2V5_9HYPH|nr:hypothetical protein [Microvirga terrae]UVF22372.1 hypothetical protein HPT29_024750 [Microvirga terrae]